MADTQQQQKSDADLTEDEKRENAIRLAFVTLPLAYLISMAIGFVCVPVSLPKLPHQVAANAFGSVIPAD